MAHTPGPWEVINQTDVFSRLGADSGDGVPADSTDGWHVADCHGGTAFVDGLLTELGMDVQKANARLISAAPDLLHALESLIGLLYSRGIPDPYPDEPEIQTICRAAIAKAKGLNPDQG